MSTCNESQGVEGYNEHEPDATPKEIPIVCVSTFEAAVRALTDPDVKALSFLFSVTCDENIVALDAAFTKNSNRLLYLQCWLASNLGSESSDAIANLLVRHACTVQTLILGPGFSETAIFGIVQALKSSTTLSMLSLSDVVRRDGVGAICQAVESNKSFFSLSVCYAQLDDDCALVFASALVNAPHLRSLYLAKSRISHVGASAIARALQSRPTLRYLSLQLNHIGDIGASALASALKQSRIEDLNLGSNKIGNEGSRAIAVGVAESTTCTCICLSHNEIGSGGDAFGPALASSTTLKSLKLSSNQLCPDVGKALGQGLAHSKSIERLDVSDNQLGDDGSVGLALGLEQNCSLRNLYLRSNSIGDAGAIALGTALSLPITALLKTLNLCQNAIGEKGACGIASGLRNNTTVKDLSLAGNQIGSGGCAAIGIALSTNTWLERLDLSRNNIDSGGLATFASLSPETRLQNLDLFDNSIDDIDAMALATGLQNCSAIDVNLRRNMITSGATLVACRGLGKLDLSENLINDDSTDAIAAAIESNVTPRQVKLGGTRQVAITSVGAARLFAALKRNNTLKLLHLNRCPIYEVGVEFLYTEGRVTALYLDNFVWPPPSVSKQGFDAIYTFLRDASLRSAPLSRSRIMFVGCGGSGKTTLKSALLLKSPEAREFLTQLRESMVEAVELWTTAQLHAWVDNDVAQQAGFFSQFPAAARLTGKEYLSLSPSDLLTIFQKNQSKTTQDVVTKLSQVLALLKTDNVKAALSAASEDTSTSWPWLSDILDSLARSTAALGLRGEDAPASHTPVDVPYAVLLDLPHVWTDGVELDVRLDGYTLWDFPGQMELYPSHRLFLACETAVYVMVVNGLSGVAETCLSQLYQWLSLIRSGMLPGNTPVAVRVVVTHTDRFTRKRRQALLRTIHESAVSEFGQHFQFGTRCYSTLYTEEDGGDVDTLRTELASLKHEVNIKRPLPIVYQAICDEVLQLARKHARWPVVPREVIDTRGSEDAIGVLEDLGFLRQAGEVVILEPVTWLSRLMVAFLHPYHGLAALARSRQEVALRDADAHRSAAEQRLHHLKNISVSASEACEVINVDSHVIDRANEPAVLPLLSHFDTCFCLDDNERYVFPALLPPVIALPPWLARAFQAPVECRRYSCSRAHDFIPSTLSTLLMKRTIDLSRRLGGHPQFFGRGTVIISCDIGYGGVHLAKDDKSIDIFGLGSGRNLLLSAIALHLVAVLTESYQGVVLKKSVVHRMNSVEVNDPHIASPLQHSLFGASHEALLTTTPKEEREDPSPAWLIQEYDREIPKYAMSEEFSHLSSIEQWFKAHVRRGESEIGRGRWELLTDSRLVVETKNSEDNRNLVCQGTTSSIPVKVDVIISYATAANRTDCACTRGEQALKEAAKCLVKAGFSVYHGLMCRSALAWKEEWMGRVSSSSVAVVMLSPGFFESKACLEELHHVLDSDLAHSCIPVIVADPKGVAHALNPENLAQKFAELRLFPTTDLLLRAKFMCSRLRGNFLPPPPEEFKVDAHGEDLVTQVKTFIHRLAGDT